MLHGLLHLLGMDHETDGGRMARAEKRWRARLALPAGLIERVRRMILALVMLIAALLAPLLGLVTFVQLLYLESLRLRTRDLPALKFFKETLEDKLGFKTEDGAGSFLADQTHCLVLLGVLYFLPVRRRRSRGLGRRFWQTVAGGVAHHDRGGLRAAAVALPPHRGAWLLPLAPLLRGLAWLARPCVARAGLLPIAGRTGRRNRWRRGTAHARRRISKR